MPESDLPSPWQRLDESPDRLFYQHPRFVYHLDETAVSAVTQLYREHFEPGQSVLDLMSSWVSHLPSEITYGRVFGLGMNEAELSKNERLNAYRVQDLNEQPYLRFDDNTFHQAAICVSVDYLTQPVTVMREIGRVLKPGGPLVITYSNRCFPTKVIAAWLKMDDAGRLAWVKNYLVDAGNWEHIETFDRSTPGADPLFAVVARAKASGS